MDTKKIKEELLGVIPKSVPVSDELLDCVAGGLALSDPAADLAVCVAVASSLLGFSLPPTLSVMGEVGLCGEVRPVSQVERRVAECVRLGFTDILLPKQNMKNLKPMDGVTLTGVDTLMQALAMVSD